MDVTGNELLRENKAFKAREKSGNQCFQSGRILGHSASANPSLQVTGRSAYKSDVLALGNYLGPFIRGITMDCSSSTLT